ncbi:MAG: hypothetical protein A2289_24555 [Deltaproteobacteria bacterium RIFOXYA12_FULL_58_15]|nr:MAG: hypothetical protein A2289_24555 [Deltaproteobacteria bacterium RIFOXYA12_FULL_58_15]OGR12719.1 MAG: hypothetical protein A2341_07865 [Deltaproteobacteria bacterium RIFOXYB12_FULL_58_9]
MSAFACVDNAADVKADDNNIAPQALTTTPPSATRTPVATATSLAVFPGERTLLFSQAHFERVMHEGKEIPKPLPAKLLMLTPEGDGFRADILQDQESRVFHKAICVKTDVGVRLLTIGGTEAILKMWRVEEGAWKADTLWNPKFGGKWDRLRDFEVGNVDDDPEFEIVIATHDQGVVAVANRTAGGWDVIEAQRQANTFVHEIEIGDVVGKGKPSFFATPSAPNKANQSQSGGIVMFTKKADGFARTQIADLSKSHAKEILVADLDGDGKPELYTAIEAELNGNVEKSPVEIRRFVPSKRGAWKSQVVASLPGARQSRVLLAADLTGTGKPDIIATTYKDGIWRLTPPHKPNGKWSKSQIDANSSGFEHAAGVADLNGDGKPELYVADDDKDEIRQYAWDGNSFTRKVIHKTGQSDLTWFVAACAPEEL